MKNALTIALMLLSITAFAQPEPFRRTDSRVVSGPARNHAQTTCCKTRMAPTTTISTSTMTATGGTIAYTKKACHHGKYHGKKGRGHTCRTHHGPPRHHDHACH